jgi:hypothetical protein
MFVRLCAAYAFLTMISQAADPTAKEIMAQVALNQDKAIQMRSNFIYQQHLDVATRHFNGKLAREEKADYEIAPAASSMEKKLVSIAGQCEEKGHLVAFTGQPVKECGSLDKSLVESFRDDLLNEKSKDGLGNDLFPLTTEQQKQYKFELLGHKQVEGRDTYLIRFSPADSHDIDWAGEAWIDVEELQPVRVFTQLSRRIPFFVRTMLGTDVPGVGFNVQYRRVEKDVWFPVSFGSEFRLRAVFFIKRDITMSMQASGFRKTQVDSKIDYDVKAANETHSGPTQPDTPPIP